jgi:hypothetical protein
MFPDNIHLVMNSSFEGDTNILEEAWISLYHIHLLISFNIWMPLCSVYCIISRQKFPLFDWIYKRKNNTHVIFLKYFRLNDSSFLKYKLMIKYHLCLDSSISFCFVSVHYETEFSYVHLFIRCCKRLLCRWLFTANQLLRVPRFTLCEMWDVRALSPEP